MYVMWYVVFGVVGLMIAAIIGICVFYHLRNKNCNSWLFPGKKSELFETLAEVCTFILVATIIVNLFLVAAAIINPISAKNEVRVYQYQYEMSESLIEDGNLEQNILIGSVAKDSNIWLANARADKERWGEWSMYYDCDLDSLKYIGEK